MLTIQVGGIEAYDELTSKFVTQDATILHLEHSLLSLSKWESVFEKPFLERNDKTPEEILEYIKYMCVDDNIAPEVFQQLSRENYAAINRYLEASQSATWFSDQPEGPRSREVITSELVYYWMSALHIPFECESWNLNRLFILIRVCNAKQQKPKKMSRATIAQRNRELNAQRKAQLGTTG